MKRYSVYLGGIILAMLICTASPAKAGLSEAINNFFTFREDQRDLVAPRQNIPPIIAETPYYDEGNAQRWSQYYTRNDLDAVNYMDSSSKVMRPSQTRPNIDYRQRNANNRTNPALVPQMAIGGYDTIGHRARINENERYRGNIYVGVAGTNPNSTLDTGFRVAKKTQIGNPVRSWKDGASRDFANPREGDFDYNAPTERGYADQGYAVANQDEYAPHNRANNHNNKHNTSQPSNYTVRQNDSLSGISDQDQIYGDWKLWPLIYDANRAQIKDPDLIHPGQNLGIPRDQSQKQREGARYRALQKQPPYLFDDGR